MTLISQERAILFADVSGSTALYEKLGWSRIEETHFRGRAITIMSRLVSGVPARDERAE